MGSVQELLTLADRVEKLDAVATAATRAESCQLSRPSGRPAFDLDRRVLVTLTFLNEHDAKAYVDALAALTAKPAAGPRPIAMTTVGAVVTGGTPTVVR